MDEIQTPIDLDLWLNSDLFRRQNLLKSQFIAILEEVGNNFPNRDLTRISPNSRGIKISKGNDLLGFPYQVLDLIRDFDTLEGVNIRLLNWFGNGFFITVLIGKNRNNPIKEFLEMEFSFGQSENQWDYPDLILTKNFTTSQEKISKSELGFHHWIKRVDLLPEPQTIVKYLNGELKKIIGILELPKD
ncbi:hypothetical protein D0X99_11410 [Algoriphagus lacus]|uniref:Uncharacterized protein n=1 Tax=Algoriphagus lacus TaxID=2056311 RepID=A0A418PR16_9BACT|nr:hypothetical protein [Algoriphagus lacus]RIW15050.1 hypothetical protein D0X99_11410 [Algoriphagus lacus]